ncbi:hypothetical protein [Paenibacillus sp. 1P07SE]|uniref:hypothetical protein n=1 Tax=Paenibacillus sp. 1P07SE TaxID=3132209 RepID=UPI0039A58BEA
MRKKQTDRKLSRAYSPDQLQRSQAMAGWNRDVLQAILKAHERCTLQEAEQAIHQFMTREAN